MVDTIKGLNGLTQKVNKAFEFNVHALLSFATSFCIEPLKHVETCMKMVQQTVHNTFCIYIETTKKDNGHISEFNSREIYSALELLK